MRDFTPRPYQTIAVEHMAGRDRAAIWAGMGMGKSSSVLQLLDVSYNLMGDDYPTLVLAPLRVAQSTWPGEVKKWRQFAGLGISPVIGSEAERIAALKRDVPIKTMNYENLPWLVEKLGKRWPFRRVVADESTRLKGFRLRGGGRRSRALGRVAHAKVNGKPLVTQMIQLTGTPSPNGLIDLWGQIWFLDEGQRLGRTFGAFQDRWFQTLTERGGYPLLRVKDHANDEIQHLLRDLCLTLDPKDWFDLREPIVTTIYVDLPARARRMYEDMEKTMFMEIEGNEVEAFGAAARTIKCLQLANGAAYVGESNERWVEVHDEKLQALESVVEESVGTPVLVAYHFKSDLARLLKAFPQGRPLDADPGTIDDWNAGRIPLLFAHPASAGHGLNLQDGGNILVVFGHWWDLEQYQQIVERIGPVRQQQAGHDRAVFIYHIVARDTVDELVMARRETKASVQDLLLQAMKRKN